jgi:hypothetical protein
MERHYVIQIPRLPSKSALVPGPTKYIAPLTDTFNTKEEAIDSAHAMNYKAFRIVDNEGNVVYESPKKEGGRRRLVKNKKTRSKRMNKRYTKRR